MDYVKTVKFRRHQYSATSAVKLKKIRGDFDRANKSGLYFKEDTDVSSDYGSESDSFLNLRGVIPVCFLKAALNTDFELNPLA